MTDTNPTEELKSGPITDAEISDWENALSEADKLQLRRLQLQQAAINRAAPKHNPTDAEIAVMSNEELRRYTRQFGF